MKKHFALIALILTLLASCGSTGVPDEPPPSEVDIGLPSPELPPEPSGPSPAWDALLPVRFEKNHNDSDLLNLSCKLEFPEDEILTEIAAWNRYFTYRGGNLTVNLLFTLSPRDQTRQETEVGIAVLCDGVPVPFSIVKGNTTQAANEQTLFYNGVFASNTEHTMQLSIDPVFTEDPGYVQVILHPSLELYTTKFTQMGSDFFVEGTGSAAGTDLPLVVETVPIEAEPRLLETPFVSADGIEEKQKAEDLSGNFHIVEMRGKTELVYEFAPQKTGRHRAVFFLDDQVITLPDGKLCIEWTQEEGQMVQYRIPLDGLLTPGAHRFFECTTLLEGRSEETRLYTQMVNSGVFQVIP